MIILTENDKPVMQGKTELKPNQTFEHNKKKGLDIICSGCATPFVESLQKSGVVCNCVVCSVCKAELAFVVEMTEIEIYSETLRGIK